MTGNSFGRIFRITTFGESHGKGLGVVIDGCPPKIELSEEEINIDLKKRRPGQSNVSTSRKEKDKAEILSGVFEGKTTGTPICVLIRNEDADSSKYEKIKDVFRPGHADFSYQEKYGIRDYRGGGRSSGRETAARVAAGAVAKKILDKDKVKIIGYAKEIGNVKTENIDFKEIEKNPVRCPDSKAAKIMEDLIIQTKKEGDSVGGVVEIIVKNCPKGIGDPVFDKLESDLGKALLSLGAVKGIEFGIGFGCSKLKGSENNDPMGQKGFTSNYSGGILGGISTGEDIIIRIAVKPTPSISKNQKTVDKKGKETEISIEGRHDPCIVPRIIPVAEAMVAIVLADKILMQKSVG